MKLPGREKDTSCLHALLLEYYVVFVNWVGTEGELVFWSGSHLVDPRGRMVAEAPLYREQMVTADLNLGEVPVATGRYPCSRTPGSISSCRSWAT